MLSPSPKNFHLSSIVRWCRRLGIWIKKREGIFQRRLDDHQVLGIGIDMVLMIQRLLLTPLSERVCASFAEVAISRCDPKRNISESIGFARQSGST